MRSRGHDFVAEEDQWFRQADGRFDGIGQRHQVFMYGDRVDQFRGRGCNFAGTRVRVVGRIFEYVDAVVARIDGNFAGVAGRDGKAQQGRRQEAGEVRTEVSAIGAHALPGLPSPPAGVLPEPARLISIAQCTSVVCIFL